MLCDLGGSDEGLGVVELDQDAIAEVRAKMPVFDHYREDLCGKRVIEHVKVVDGAVAEEGCEDDFAGDE